MSKSVLVGRVRVSISRTTVPDMAVLVLINKEPVVVFNIILKVESFVTQLVGIGAPHNVLIIHAYVVAIFH
jgi:hypothetical protein